MSRIKLTDFGLAVKTELLKIGKPQKWLEEEVTRKTGLYMDCSYMHKILTGQSNPAGITQAIREILGMEDGNE